MIDAAKFLKRITYIHIFTSFLSSTYSTNTIIYPLTTCIKTAAIINSHDLLVAKTDGDFVVLVVPGLLEHC